MARRIAYLIVGLSCAFIAIFGAQLPWDTTYLASWWLPLAATLTMPPLALLALGAVAHDERMMRWGALLFGSGFMVAIAAWYVAWTGDRVDAAFTANWLAHMSTIPCMAAALAGPVEYVATYSVIAVVASRSIFVVTGSAAWFPDHFVDTLANLALSLVVAVLARMALDAAGALDAGWEDAHATAARHAAERARLVERDRIGDLLHDWVLSTLLAAARQSSSTEIRRHAALAVSKLQRAVEVDQDIPCTASQAAETVRVVLQELDPTIRWSGRTVAGAIYPAQMIDVFSACLAEALRNSQRHGGHDTRSAARLDIEPDVLTAEISDDGTGFDATSQHFGYGLTRIHERIAAIDGATVAVSSRPGGGTVMRLQWRRPPAEKPGGTDFRVLVGLQSRLARIGAVFFGVTSVACAVATHHPGESIPMTTAAVSMVSAAAGALALDPRDPLTKWATLSITLGLPLANAIVFTTSVMPITAAHLWPNFLASAFAPILCFRGRTTAAVLTLTLCSTPVILMAGHTGHSTGYWVSDALGGVGSILLGIFFSTTVRPVMRDIHKLRHTSAVDHAAGAAAEIASAERIRYLAAIRATALPTLKHIAHQPLSRDERRDVAVLEARLRSMIRAPGLIDPAINAAVDAARARAVDVVMIDDSHTPRLRASARQIFNQTVKAELERAPAAGTVTIRLVPDHHPYAGTIVTTHEGQTLRQVAVDAGGQVIDIGTRKARKPDRICTA